MVTSENLATHPVDAPSALRLFSSKPRVLAMGEPTHGADILLEVRNDLFKRLVEDEGYRTIAIESDCLLGLIVDDYVRDGQVRDGRVRGDLDEVMARGFSHGFGASRANRELVRWMRAFNEGRPAADQVRFAGLDGPLEISGAESPREALTRLHAYLAARVDPDLLPCDAATLDRLLGADERWTEPAAMMDPSRSAGRTAEAGELRLLADDLTALLEEQSPLLTADPASPADPAERDELDRARLYARTATGLLRYHSWMADTSRGRLSRLLGVRDSMMAANLLALAERAPVLVFMHNSHLQREPSTMRMWGPDGPEGPQVTVTWWSAGAQAGATLGERYGLLATALGTIRHQGVHEPPADTLEGLLYARGEARCLVAPGDLTQALSTHAAGTQAPDTQAQGDAPAPRVSPWFGYAPLDPAHLPRVEGVVFVRDVPAA